MFMLMSFCCKKNYHINFKLVRVHSLVAKHPSCVNWMRHQLLSRVINKYKNKTSNFRISLCSIERAQSLQQEIET